ncbi:MAG: hypothetical protein HRU12_19960 [Phaeodactylibacter sp.]|nr:hypothetical protein [Phaeodactylibacter sp.]
MDEHLQSLPLQNFPNIWQFDNPVTDTVPVHYRMAYTPTHLYLYIEAASPSINYRNRGFINGDGFKLLLGLPQPDGQTDEYYDLVFSASKDTTYWARKRVWEHNHDQGFNRPLSNKSLFRETAANGVSGFEALIAWSDIPPYHPWFTKNMGYNLYFAKAIGDTITNGYAAVPDEGIWDEELPKRSYAALPFQQPKPTEQSVFLLQPEQRHIDYQSALRVKGVSLFIPTGEQAVEIAILKGIDTIVWQGQFALPYGKKLREAVFALPTEALSPGVYELVLAPTETASDTLSFVIFPPMDFRKIQAEIQQNQHGLPKRDH